MVAEIGRTRGSRFATLTGRLGVSGESLRRTLRALQVDGLVARNPGYGHPLRPDYVLTARGSTLAPAAQQLLHELRGHEEVGLKKWSLPVLAALDDPRRFSELRVALPTASPRALTLALKDLQASGLVRRTVLDDWPPSVVYEVTAAATPIAAAARAVG